MSHRKNAKMNRVFQQKYILELNVLHYRERRNIGWLVYVETVSTIIVTYPIPLYSQWGPTYSYIYTRYPLSQTPKMPSTVY